MKNIDITHAKRNSTLDIIRGLAVLLIVFHHLVVPARFPLTNLTEKIFRYGTKLIAFFNLGGWVGVDLFFVLSGFLVSGLLFNEYKKYNNINIKRFLIRRGFKIYPAFVFFILFTFVAERLISYYNPVTYYPAADYIKDLFFLHNYLEGRWGQTWSLDVEEFFYLCLPVVFYFLVKKRKLDLPVLTNIYLSLLIFGIIARAIAVHYHPSFDFTAQYGRTHFRLDALFCGVLISYIYNYSPHILDPVLKRKRLLGLLAVFVIAINFFLNRADHNWMAVIMVAINPIAFGILLIIALNLKRGLHSGFLEYIGKNSYSIYLWHYVLVNYAEKFIPYLNSLVTGFSQKIHGFSYMFIYLSYVVVYVVASVLIGIAFGNLIEEPFLKLRDRLYPSKTKAIIHTQEEAVKSTYSPSVNS